jgi:hypothetical protein
MYGALCTAFISCLALALTSCIYIHTHMPQELRCPFTGPCVSGRHPLTHTLQNGNSSEGGRPPGGRGGGARGETTPGLTFYTCRHGGCHACRQAAAVRWANGEHDTQVYTCSRGCASDHQPTWVVMELQSSTSNWVMKREVSHTCAYIYCTS